MQLLSKSFGKSIRIDKHFHLNLSLCLDLKMLRDLAIITLGLSHIVNIALSITVVGPGPASLMPACLRWLCAGPDLFLGVGPGPSCFRPWSGIFLVLVQFQVVDQVQRLWVLRPSAAKVLDLVQPSHYQICNYLQRPDS